MKWAICALVLWCACSGDSGIKTADPTLRWETEYWDSGRLKAEFQYFVGEGERRIKHGVYREYSRYVTGLLTVEGHYVEDEPAGSWYQRCRSEPADVLFENGGFEAGDFSGWRLEGVRDNSIELVAGGGARRGLYSARLTLFPGDIIRSGNRVELVRADSGRYGQERIYSWSFKIDADYEEEPYWQAICQFHSQPDFSQGEDWENYPEHKPPLSILYSNNKCRLIYHSFEQVPREIGSFEVEKGVWFDVFFQIGWSLQEDGYVEMYVDDKPVTEFNGTDFKFYSSNVYNEVGNYLKVGLYRDQRAQAINSVYIDELAIEGC